MDKNKIKSAFQNDLRFRHVSIRLSNVLWLITLLLIVVVLTNGLGNMALKPGEKTVFTDEKTVARTHVEKPPLEKAERNDVPLWISFLLFIPFFYLAFVALRKMVGFIREVDKGGARDVNWKSLIVWSVLGIVSVLVVSLSIPFVNRIGIDGGSRFVVRAPVLVRDPIFPNNLTRWVIMAGITALIALVWIRGRKSKPSPREADSTNDLIAREAHHTVTDFLSGKEAKTIIIRCYHNMCRLIGEQRQLTRKNSMTANEFVDYMVQMGFTNNHAETLTRLFEQARYGEADFQGRHIDEAVACLKEIGNHPSQPPVEHSGSN